MTIKITKIRKERKLNPNNPKTIPDVVNLMRLIEEKINKRINDMDYYRDIRFDGMTNTIANNTEKIEKRIHQLDYNMMKHKRDLIEIVDSLKSHLKSNPTLTFEE